MLWRIFRYRSDKTCSNGNVGLKKESVLVITGIHEVTLHMLKVQYHLCFNWVVLLLISKRERKTSRSTYCINLNTLHLLNYTSVSIKIVTRSVSVKIIISFVKLYLTWASHWLFVDFRTNRKPKLFFMIHHLLLATWWEIISEILTIFEVICCYPATPPPIHTHDSCWCDVVYWFIFVVACLQYSLIFLNILNLDIKVKAYLW